MLDRIARARARARAHAWKLIEATAGRVPVAGHRREDPDRLGGHRHGRHPGHRPLGQGGSRSDLEERLRLPPAGGLVPRTPASAWPCCCAPATPGRTRSPTTRRCWPRRSGRSPPGSGARSWSASTGPAPATTSIEHLLSLSSPRRTLLFTCGWMITAADEDAIRQVPAAAWKPGTAQDGAIEEDKDVAEITRPDEPRRELARRAAVDRPPGEAVPPADEEPDRLREEDRLAVLDHLHEHPRTAGSPASRAATTPSTSTSSTASTPSWRPAASAPRRPWACANLPSKTWQVNARLGHRGEHRRRPHRLDPPPRPLRRPRTAGSRPGNAPLPDLAHPRPARPPRPPADPRRSAPTGPGQDAFLDLLAAALRPASTRLTSTNQPQRHGRRTQPGAVGAGAHPGTPGSHARGHPPGQTDTTPETGRQHNQ